jgi:hypothetical protein
MAETETTERTESENKTNGGNGHDTRKAAVRAAAIAAASGATAFAAKRAFSRGSDDEGRPKQPARRGDDSLITTMVSSAWDSAHDTLVPMLENAATHAGEYVARNAPDIVTDTLVPQFIRGFEGAQKKSSSGEDDAE